MLAGFSPLTRGQVGVVALVDVASVAMFAFALYFALLSNRRFTKFYVLYAAIRIMLILSNSMLLF